MTHTPDFPRISCDIGDILPPGNAVYLGGFLRFFFMWTIFKFLLKLLQYCFCYVFWFFGCMACGILASWPGIKPAPPALKGEVLTMQDHQGSPCIFGFQIISTSSSFPMHPCIFPNCIFPLPTSWWNRGRNVSHQRFEVLCTLAHEVLGKSKKGLLGNED